MTQCARIEPTFLRIANFKDQLHGNRIPKRVGRAQPGFGSTLMTDVGLDAGIAADAEFDVPRSELAVRVPTRTSGVSRRRTPDNRLFSHSRACTAVGIEGANMEKWARSAVPRRLEQLQSLSGLEGLKLQGCGFPRLLSGILIFGETDLRKENFAHTSTARDAEIQSSGIRF